MNLVEETLRGYVREAKILKERLHNNPKHIGTIDDAQRFIEMKIRYQFLTDMFNQFNWFRWSDDDFTIEL